MARLRCGVVVVWVVLFGCTIEPVDLASKTVCPCAPGYECVRNRCAPVDEVRDVPSPDAGATTSGDAGGTSDAGDDASSDAGGMMSGSDGGADAGAIACPDGEADCDGDPSNGCESLATTAHCGQCGNDCEALTDVESATCVDGACRIDACIGGSSDCNDSASDGCEQPHIGCTLEVATFDSDPLETGSIRSNQTLHAFETLVGTGMCAGLVYDIRAVLSFDTADLPNGAEIDSAFVTLALGSVYGDPWAGDRYLVVDIADGCFGTACAREGFDYEAEATVNSVAVVEAWTSGTQDSSELSSEGVAAVNPMGQTQIRLRFDTQLACDNWIVLDGATPQVLTVRYYAP